MVGGGTWWKGGMVEGEHGGRRAWWEGGMVGGGMVEGGSGCESNKQGRGKEGSLEVNVFWEDRGGRNKVRKYRGERGIDKHFLPKY